ncbi:MAG: biopolymer transporter ExbD, partial [Planctomycetia bacterium]
VVQADELQSRLVAARQAYAGQSVIIRGDGDGSYQSVVDVMSLCHKAQIHRFSLAFQPTDSGKSQTP